MISKSSLTDLLLEKKPVLDNSRIFSCGVENSSSIKINLKLVIRISDGKILYAQGEKDFADLLLSFLTFPLGGIVRVFGGNCSMGSIDELYKSIADLDENIYLISQVEKNRLVDPHILPQFQLSNKILPIIEPNEWQYYCQYDIYDGSPRCLQFFKDVRASSDFKQMKLAYPEFEGFVKGPAMYVATDDLVVAPFSAISALNLLNRLNTPFKDLKEKVVTIGINEVRIPLDISLPFCV